MSQQQDLHGKLLEAFGNAAVELHEAFMTDRETHSIDWSSSSAVKKHGKRANARVAKCRRILLRTTVEIMATSPAAATQLLSAADERIAFYAAEHFRQHFPQVAEAAFRRLAHSGDPRLAGAAKDWVERFEKGYGLA